MLDPAGGRQLPFVHVYNEVHGIHLVILFTQHGALKFPVGYRVYRGKGTPTPVPLARDLLRTVPDTVRTRFRVHALADSGSPAAAFLDEVRRLDFELYGRPGAPSLPASSPLRIARMGDTSSSGIGRTTPCRSAAFSAASVYSRSMEGDEVSSERAKRWQIESFFKESNHPFGLNRCEVRLLSPSLNAIPRASNQFSKNT
ncbi:transposase [Deinococcus petrolearius]|uniref:Transposase n=1 Tax=Deinococcus petrolearius TaxID=1751295 RepID=A0ABW1DDU6_9DEIO